MNEQQGGYTLEHVHSAVKLSSLMLAHQARQKILLPYTTPTHPADHSSSTSPSPSVIRPLNHRNTASVPFSTISLLGTLNLFPVTTNVLSPAFPNNPSLGSRCAMSFPLASSTCKPLTASTGRSEMRLSAARTVVNAGKVE